MQYKHIACSTEHQQMETRETAEMTMLLHTEQHKTEPQNATQVEHCLNNSNRVAEKATKTTQTKITLTHPPHTRS